MRIRPRYPFLFLLSLVVAFVLWYGLAAQRRANISVRGMRATVTLVNLPRELVVTSPVPDSVSVQLRGPLSRALGDTNALEVLLDLLDARPGTRTYAIDESSMSLPPNVDLVSVDPPALTVELERQATRSLPIRPTIEGTPLAGYTTAEVRVSPPLVTVQGPESRLDDLEFLTTTPVSIAGATGPVEASVQPELPDDRLIRLLTIGAIGVTVDIRPVPAPQPTPGDRRR